MQRQRRAAAPRIDCSVPPAPARLLVALLLVFARQQQPPGRVMDIVIGSACSVICYNFCCRCCAGKDGGIPRTIDGVSPAYLTGILRADGSLESSVCVTAVEVQKISSEETGLTSSVYFLKLMFDRATSCPSAVVYKMLNQDFVMRILFKMADLASNEINFLREYPKRVADGRPAIRIPRPLATQYNDRTQDFAIVSEDLRAVGRPGSQLRGTVDVIPDAKRALDALAVLHADYWEDYDSALSFLKKQNHPKRAIVPVVFKDSWPKAIAWMRERPGLTHVDAIAAVGEELLSPDLPPGQYMEECQTPPLTVIHGDCHSENFLFPTAATEAAIVMDFQLTAIGTTRLSILLCLSQEENRTKMIL